MQSAYMLNAYKMARRKQRKIATDGAPGRLPGRSGGTQPGRRTWSSRGRKAPPAAEADSEAAFLAAYDASAFERPSVAVDVVLFTVSGGEVFTLLARRGEHPHKGRSALPGGFVGGRESLEAAASRVLDSKAGVRNVFLEQLYTFGDPDRDPRTRVITVAYFALVDRARLVETDEVAADAQLARLVVPWDGETGGPVQAFDMAGHELPLAFDHADILGMAVKRLRGKLNYTPIGFQLLPDTFTLFDLQSVHEAVLG